MLTATGVISKTSNMICGFWIHLIQNENFGRPSLYGWCFYDLFSSARMPYVSCIKYAY